MDIEDHDVGKEHCETCWMGYPVPCSCGGMIHAEFGDYSNDVDYWLEKMCDKCGDEYKEADEE